MPPLLPLLVGIVLWILFIPGCEPDIPAQPLHEPVMMVEQSRTENGGRYIVGLTSDGHKVAVHIRSILPEVEIGDSVRILADIPPVTFGHTAVPDEVDNGRELYRQGIVASVILGRDKVRVLGSEHSIRTFALRARSLLLSSALDDRTGSLLCATLLGDTSRLAPPLRSQWAEAGIAHVLALSGMHVGVILVIIGFILWPLRLTLHNRTRIILTLAMLWLFTIFTGAAPSVTRAVLMCTVYLVGRMIERRSSPANSLCLAAIVILVANPLNLYSPGFLMSFAAVAGILAFYPLLNPWNRFDHPWRYRLCSLPALSISAMAFTAPIAALFFHSYPLYFLLTNLLIALLVPLLIGGGAVLLILLWLGFAATPLCVALNSVAAAISAIAQWVSTLPAHCISGLYFHPLWLVPFIGATALLAWALRRPAARRMVAFGSLTLLILTPMTHAIAEPIHPMHEHFLLPTYRHTDVLIRHGDRAWLYTTARGSALRADALDAAQRRCEHYLSRRNLPALQLLPDSIGPCLNLGGKKHLFVCSNYYPRPDSVNVLVVCRGFSGDVLRLRSDICPDTVILSTDLHPRTLRRFKEALFPPK